MKKIILSLCAIAFLGCFLGKAQTVNTQNALNQFTPIPTTPANVSQMEVTGKQLTQNSQPIPAGLQITGSFDPTARWNSMGNLVAPSQVLNGFRTQTDGRALATGHSIPNLGTVSNPFIEWIGNNAVVPAVTPGNLEFRYALNSTGAAGARVSIFTMAPSPSVTIPSFNYAEKDALVGQLQSGAFGSFGVGDTWSATGPIRTPSFLIYGDRHQYAGYTINTSLIKDNVSNQVKAVIDFGNNTPLGLGSYIFQFRAFTDPNNSASNKNIWQSSNKFNDMLLGRQDYGTVANGHFYLSLYDGVGSTTSNTALNFIRKAGIYATSDGRDQNAGGAQLPSYAAIVGDVSGVNLIGAATTKYAILGIADGNYVSGNSFSPWAGYFIGNVGFTGSLINVSDKKFKTNINTEDNIMPKLMQLQPKNYKFDVVKFKNMAFSNKLQHGLISEEVEKIFPELVEDAFAPGSSTNPEEDGKPVPYKGVNYTGFIPMLLKGLQELQNENNDLRSRLEKVETATANNTLVLNDKINLPKEIENKAFSLSQNLPNPFSENTTISYTIPSGVNKAMLGIFDLNGKMVLQYNLSQGKNNVVINGNSLTAGMYIYSLIADGQEVISKRMILTK